MCILPCPPLWLSSPPNVLLAPPPALLWQTSLHTPSPLSSTHAVRSSCCPLLLLSTPPRKQNKKHAKHCSSPVHLIPFFLLFFYPPPVLVGQSLPIFLLLFLTRQRQHFEKNESSAHPLSSSDRFCPSFLVFPYEQCKDDIPMQLYTVMITCLSKPYFL